MAMAPTQNRRLAVINALDTETGPPLRTRCSVRFWTQSPRVRIRRSKSSSSPKTAPSTMERMATRVCSPLRQPLMPMRRMHRARPWRMIPWSRRPRSLRWSSDVEHLPAPHFSSIPTAAPVRMDRALTMVPVNMAVSSSLFRSSCGQRRCPEAVRPWQAPRACWRERCAVPGAAFPAGQ